jgi:hypothetical protein
MENIEDLFIDTGTPRHIYGVPEVELTGSLDDLRLHGDCCTWDWFCAFTRDKIVRISPGVFIGTRTSLATYETYGLYPHQIIIETRQTDTGRIDRLDISYYDQEQVASTCDFLVLLMPRNTMNYFKLFYSTRSGLIFDRFSVPSATLSRLMVESHGNLRELEMEYLTLEEEQVHLLATASPNLDVKLCCCTIPDAAGNAFIECLQSNRGPTELYKCQIDAQILATALRGNHHLKCLWIFSIRGAEYFQTFAAALAENLGLVELNLFYFKPVSDNVLFSLCRSLRAHPTLAHLDLSGGFPRQRLGPGPNPLTDEQKAYRTCAIVDMLQVNTVLHEILFLPDEMDAQIFQDAIQPRLRENFYRSKLHTVSEARGTLRAKLLGRALATVANYPELVGTLVGENREVTFASFIRQGRN